MELTICPVQRVVYPRNPSGDCRPRLGCTAGRRYGPGLGTAWPRQLPFGCCTRSTRFRLRLLSQYMVLLRLIWTTTFFFYEYFLKFAHLVQSFLRKLFHVSFSQTVHSVNKFANSVILCIFPFTHRLFVHRSFILSYH